MPTTDRPLDNFVQEYARRAQSRRDFITSSRFSELMDEFRRVVDGGNIISQEAVNCELVKYPFTKDEFRDAVESVFENHPPEEVTREGGSFPVLATNYKGLGFSVMIGQGSSYDIGPEISGLTTALDWDVC